MHLILNIRKSEFFPTAIFLAVIAGLFSICLVFSEALLYQREALQENREFWRLISGHFCHLTWEHGILNFITLSSLLIAVQIVKPMLSMHILSISILFSALLSSVAFYLFFQKISYYGGFSGILHSLFVLIAILYVIFRPRLIGALILLAIMLKLGYEYSTGQTTTGIDIPVVSEAHLIGAIIGVIISLPIAFAVRNQPAHRC